MKLNKTVLLAGKLTLVLLLLLQPAFAEKVENLYTLSSLVKDTSDEERATAANQLLYKLLVRVSGTEKVLEKLPPKDFSKDPEAYAEHPDYSTWSALSSAQQLINQYSYTTSSELLTLPSGEQVASPQQLELAFDEAGVKQLLRRMQASVWDANRPKVLYWVALESKNGRTLITPASNAPLTKVLIEQNQVRGIPYQLPEFSKYPASDTLFSDIWGGFSQQIIAASDPYHPDAIAVGKIKASGSNWQVEWQLFTGMGSIRHTTSVKTLRQALDEGVSFTAEELSSRYASQAGQGAGTYKVMVSNVRQVQDYASLNNYLNGLSLTSKVRVVQSTDQRILFEISLRGGLDQLRANLALDGRLKEESFFGLQQATNITKQAVNTEPEQEPAEQADAYFRWQAK